MPCKKCSQPVDVENDSYTVCRGRCSQRFHSQCADITADTIRALRCRNVIFLCDDCLVEFGSIRYRQPSELLELPQIMDEVTELKTKVTQIVEMLSEGNRKLPSGDTGLRKYSTPVSSKPSLSGTLSSRNDSSAFQRDSTEFDTTNGRHSFALVLSNINSRVTDDEIDLLVSRSLGATESDSFEVTKLVPRWKVCAELDYVSFKIVLDEKWRRAAFSASTWPKPIRFREFVNRQPVTWSPT